MRQRIVLSLLSTLLLLPNVLPSGAQTGVGETPNEALTTGKMLVARSTYTQPQDAAGSWAMARNCRTSLNIDAALLSRPTLDTPAEKAMDECCGNEATDAMHSSELSSVLASALPWEPKQTRTHMHACLPLLCSAELAHWSGPPLELLTPDPKLAPVTSIRAPFIAKCQHQSELARGARATIFDAVLNVQSPIRSQPLLLEIKVRSSDDNTFETMLCCPVSNCGKTVDIDSNGPKAVQNVSVRPPRRAASEAASAF